MKTLHFGFIRLLTAAIITALGLGLALMLDEKESRALDGLPEEQVQRLAADASGAHLISVLASDDGRTSAVMHSTDGGRTWLDAGRLPATQIGALAVVHSANGETWMLAAAGQRLFYANVQTSDWRSAPLTWPANDAQINSLAFDIVRGRLLIGASAGLFALPFPPSADLQPAGAGLPDAAPVTQVLVSAANPQRIFAATPQGLFTLGAADSWMRVAQVSAPVHHLLESADLLLAATGANGLYRSLDGGQTWGFVAGALGAQPGVILDVTALTADPRDRGVLYAATGIWAGSTQMRFRPGALFVSVDNGVHWEMMTGADQQPLVLPARVMRLLPRSDARLSVQAVLANGERVQAAFGAFDDLLSQLERGNAAQRAWAATSLGILGDQRAAKPLLAHLPDSDASVGFSVARALGNLGDATVVPHLIDYARSTPFDDTLRLRAVIALGLLRAEDAIPTLAQIVASDPSAARSAAAAALAQIGGPVAAQALTANLTDDGLTARRQAVMAGLEQMGQEAVPALAVLLQPSQFVAGASAPLPSQFVAGASAPLSSRFVAGASAPLSSQFAVGASAPLSSRFVAGASAPLPSQFVAGASAPLPSQFVAGASAPLPSQFVAGASAPLPSQFVAGASAPLPSQFVAGASAPLPSQFVAGASAPLPSQFVAGASAPLPSQFVVGASAPLRRNAVETLGWIGAASSADLLAQVLRNDPAVMVRSEAAWALGQVGGETAQAALRAALRDDADPIVRTASAQALMVSTAPDAAGSQSLAAASATVNSNADGLARLTDLLSPPRSLILLASLLLALAALFLRPFHHHAHISHTRPARR